MIKNYEQEVIMMELEEYKKITMHDLNRMYREGYSVEHNDQIAIFYR